MLMRNLIPVGYPNWQFFFYFSLHAHLEFFPPYLWCSSFARTCLSVSLFNSVIITLRGLFSSKYAMSFSCGKICSITSLVNLSLLVLFFQDKYYLLVLSPRLIFYVVVYFSPFLSLFLLCPESFSQFCFSDHLLIFIKFWQQYFSF